MRDRIGKSDEYSAGSVSMKSGIYSALSMILTVHSVPGHVTYIMANSQPPPKQKPLTAATTGLDRREKSAHSANIFCGEANERRRRKRGEGRRRKEEEEGEETRSGKSNITLIPFKRTAGGEKRRGSCLLIGVRKVTIFHFGNVGTGGKGFGTTREDHGTDFVV